MNVIIEPADHLSLEYPPLAEMFSKLGPVCLPGISPLPVGEAVVRVVAGQMISRHAAKAIYDRIISLRNENEHQLSWMLTENELKSCGLSRNKIKTIKNFGEEYKKNPKKIEAWRKLNYRTLQHEVCCLWGLSNWSTSILAIFYFGHQDVFPEKDGTIIRAMNQIEEHLTKGNKIDVKKASPFRTYLSLYLWKSIDEGFWG